MYAPATMKTSLIADTGTAKPPRMAGAPMSWRASLAAVAIGAVALAGSWALSQGGGSPSTLSEDVQAFQQRVTAGTDTPPGAAAAEVLARRYLTTLAPDLRQRIGEQVRAEQQAGLTPSGNDAFVMRRLALYEAALQQAGSDAVAASAGNADAR
jgi:hypothetical protein